ncbi:MULTISPECIES: helix-turn-helix domain-containing protein [unclassified Streptomyces]|uniref:helix-turn-helix domain-containing protein n=1 Tax=unclassified Streptomyces TaxID=2593676 RepID=UPI002E1A444A|nr:GAF domain-containing protein [Streptomyces sp. NBC_01023]
MSQIRVGSDVLAVLELLAEEAPVEQVEELVTRALEGGVADARRDALKRARGLALRIHAQSGRRQQREMGLSALVDTARELATAQELDAVLRVVTRRARLLLGLDLAFVSFPAGEQGFVHVRSSDGHTSTRTVGLRLPAGTGPVGEALVSSAPFWTPDYPADKRFCHHPAFDEVAGAEGLRAIVAVPLSQGARPVGALCAAARNVRHFSADEISLMSSLGDLAGAAIERARLLDAARATAPEGPALRLERELSETQSRFTALVLNGGGPQPLLAELARRLDGAVRVHALDGTFLATAGEPPDERPDFGGTAHPSAASSAATSLTAPSLTAPSSPATPEARAAGEPVALADGSWAAPIVAGEEHLGTLLMFPGHRLTEFDERLLGLGARFTAIALLLEAGRSAGTHGRIRHSLLDDLLALSGHPSHLLEARARRCGIDLDKPHTVVIARPERAFGRELSSWAVSYTQRVNGLMSMREGSVVLLLPGNEAGAAARAVHAELSPLLDRRVTVAAAGPVTEALPVTGAHQEARRCLDAMTSLGATGRAASPRELGGLGVLLSGSHDVGAFIDATIGPVADYDRLRLTALVPTLEAYFETGSSPTYAAERLHVHPNTVTRRLERIGELLGAGWQQPERAFEVQLALRLSRIRHALRGGGLSSAAAVPASPDVWRPPRRRARDVTKPGTPVLPRRPRR